MSKKIAFLVIGTVFTLFISCVDDKPTVPQASSYELATSAFMADSIPFSVTASADYPLNRIDVKLFYNEVQVSSVFIPANDAGSYGGKLYVPFLKNIADGEADIQVVVKNKNFDFSVSSTTINVRRPQFAYLTLKTQYGDYQMNPVPGTPHKYAVTDNFPAQLINAIIEAPAHETNGNRFLFGGSPVKERAVETDSIPFLTDTPLGTAYTISFNTLTYEAEPFVKPSFDGYEFGEFVGGLAIIENIFTQNSSISIRGFLDMAEWWIDPTFLTPNGDGTYEFLAMTGKYRVTADRNLKFFRIEPMNGNILADFNLATRTGGIWVNGNAQTGVPSYSANSCNWAASKNFAMAPMGGGTYQVKFVPNVNIHMNNIAGTNYVNFKFYINSRSTGTGFVEENSTSGNLHTVKLVRNLYGGTSEPDPGAGTNRFSVGTGSNDGNIMGVSNRTLISGRKYVFILDTNPSPAELSIYLE